MDPPSAPNDAEAVELVSALIDEVRTILDSDDWALRPTPGTAVRLYAAAALWNACVLLSDMKDAIVNGREMSLRVLARSHIETALLGLLIHYGEMRILELLEGDLKYSLETQQQECDEYDRLLEDEAEAVAQRNQRVAHDNAGKEKWNAANVSKEPKLLLPPVAEPTRPFIRRDLSRQLATVAHARARPLSPQKVVSLLNRLAKTAAPGHENFDIIYSVGYRVLSTIGAHANLEVLSSYLSDAESNQFVRVEPEMRSPSFASAALHTALPLTAILAHRVLSAAGSKAPIVGSICLRYEE